jgi:peroxiredoxin
LDKNSVLTRHLATLFIIFSISFNLFSQVEISGKVSDSPDKSSVKLYFLLGTTPVLQDSVELKKGGFRFEKKLQRGIYRLGKDKDNSRVLVKGKEPLELTGNWGNWDKWKISPDREDLLFFSFQSIVFSTGQTINSLTKSAQKLAALQKTDPQKYQKEIEKLKFKFDSVLLDQDQRLLKISLENPDTYTGKMAGFLLRKEGAAVYDFFDPADLNDRDFLSGEIVKTKLGLYFQKYLGGSAKNWALRFDQFLAKTPPGDALYVMYSSGIEIFITLDQKYTAQLARRFYKEFPESPLAKYYYSQLPKLPPGVGDVAPDISLANPSGQKMSLSDLKGQVVLLDFWASWCGPCRRENPNVVKTYNEYKDKGFTVFSVSLDKSKDRWVGAIQKDGLVWENHVSDLKGWSSSGAKKYGVRGIPATFLIDENGVIKAVNVRGGKLESELKKMLGNLKSDG